MRMGQETKKKRTQTVSPEPEKTGTEERPGIGIAGFLGIVLLAGALFNVPAILKTPETTADRMMLVIVLVMALGGAVLLLAGRRK